MVTELKTNNMKNGPFKLKYKNSAFPFKASPAKMYFSSDEGAADRKANPHKAPKDYTHTHPQEAIVDGGQTSSDSLNTI